MLRCFSQFLKAAIIFVFVYQYIQAQNTEIQNQIPGDCGQCGRGRAHGWHRCVRKDRFLPSVAQQPFEVVKFDLNVFPSLAVNPSIQIVGCQPAASPVMLESVKAGHVVEWESQDTLSGEN